MNFANAAFSWLADPANLHGASGWPRHLAEHLGYTVMAVAIAAAIVLLFLFEAMRKKK